MQVGELDVVVVEDPEPADARAGEVERDRRAERAGADDQHAGLGQRELRRRAPLRQHELARVALDLGVGEQRPVGGAAGSRRRRRLGVERLASRAATARASSRRKPRRLRRRSCAHDPDRRARRPSTACPASRAERGTFSSASPGRAAHVERLARRQPLERELRPDPRHRAGVRRDVERAHGHPCGTVAAAWRAFLILHGYEGSGPEHWQTWLAGRLRRGGDTVAYPDLPSPDAPALPAWRAALEAELRGCPGSRSSSATRSPACSGCTTRAARARGRAAERVLLVAPPSTARSAARRSCTSSRSRSSAGASRPPPGETRLVCAPDDPYCPEGAASVYGEPLGLECDVLAGGGARQRRTAATGRGPRSRRGAAARRPP